MAARRPVSAMVRAEKVAWSSTQTLLKTRSGCRLISLKSFDHLLRASTPCRPAKPAAPEAKLTCSSTASRSGRARSATEGAGGERLASTPAYCRRCWGFVAHLDRITSLTDAQLGKAALDPPPVRRSGPMRGTSSQPHRHPHPGLVLSGFAYFSACASSGCGRWWWAACPLRWGCPHFLDQGRRYSPGPRGRAQGHRGLTRATTPAGRRALRVRGQGLAVVDAHSPAGRRRPSETPEPVPGLWGVACPRRLLCARLRHAAKRPG